jgi:hypothetical protein
MEGIGKVDEDLPTEKVTYEPLAARHANDRRPDSAYLGN